MIINIMGNSGNTLLPFHTCKRNIANDFSVFKNNILKIRSELGLPGVYKCGSVTYFFSGTPLTTFMDSTEVEIPTWLLKECIAELMPTTTDIVYISLRDSLIPK